MFRPTVGSFRCMDCDAATPDDDRHLIECPDEDVSVFVCPVCSARRAINQVRWVEALGKAESLLAAALAVGGDPMDQARRNGIWITSGTYTIAFEEYEKAAGCGFFYGPNEGGEYVDVDLSGDDLH